jgi:hypothetical protein
MEAVWKRARIGRMDQTFRTKTQKLELELESAILHHAICICSAIIESMLPNDTHFPVVVFLFFLSPPPLLSALPTACSGAH